MREGRSPIKFWIPITFGIGTRKPRKTPDYHADWLVLPAQSLEPGNPLDDFRVPAQ